MAIRRLPLFDSVQFSRRIFRVDVYSAKGHGQRSVGRCKGGRPLDVVPCWLT